MKARIAAAVALAALLSTAAGTAVPAGSAQTITARVLGILAPGGGTDGVYLRQLGGPVLAASRQATAFEPASSIKPVIALYALTRAAGGHLALTDSVARIFGSSPGDCPGPASPTFKEQLGVALRQMLQVSDNNRTRELMELFGVHALNAFAAAKGLTATHFHTAPGSPGFTIIGCASNFAFSSNPKTVDGNTTSLVDLGKVWADAMALPAPYADVFAQLAAGREMYATKGYDFTGVWPSLLSIATEEEPAQMSSALYASFVDHMTENSKGGDYWYCTRLDCSKTRWWFVSAGDAQIPSCSHGAVTSRRYVWGYYLSGANGPAEGTTSAAQDAFDSATGELLRTPIHAALATWSSCGSLSEPVPMVVAPALHTGKAVPVTSVLATVTDADTADIAPGLVATVNWGDGTTSPGVVTGAHGTFEVHGWHVYAAARTYAAVVTTTKARTAPVVAHLKISVA